jgi:carbonic anhydrase
MDHHDHQQDTERDLAAHDEFFAAEMRRLAERNAAISTELAGLKEQMAERREKRRAFVACCMDERCAKVEEALGMLPGEGFVYGSGGARVPMPTFSKFAAELEAAHQKGAEPVVYLTTHKCGAGADLGCAAFQNDVPAQIAYFNQLKKDILAAYPDFKVHVIMHDTQHDRLEEIDLDERDLAIRNLLDENARLRENLAARDEMAHGAHGIYIGHNYRAWHDEYNRYFRLDGHNPDLHGNLGIALSVMQHHSKVDLAKKPIVLHVDLPKYDDAERTAAARAELERQVEEAMAHPEAARLIAEGQIRVVRTETHADTWEGQPLA